MKKLPGGGLFLRFRCDLCGRFATKGVTESGRPAVHKRTKVCETCIREAAKLLAVESN